MRQLLPLTGHTIFLPFDDLTIDEAALHPKSTRPPPSSPHVLTLEGAAVRLGCSERKVYQLLKQKRLRRAKKVGRKTLVTVASVEKLEKMRGYGL